MSSTALKLDYQVLETSKEFPVHNILTRVLIESFCPVLKSEILFGEVGAAQGGEKHAYWIDARVEGDLEGCIAMGIDAHSLKTLALHLKTKSASGQIDLKEALAVVFDSFAEGFERQFIAEDFHCTLKRGSGLQENYSFAPGNESFLMCPVETRCGVVKVYYGLKPASQELQKELSSRNAVLEPRKIRIYASQLESIYTGIKDLEGLEGQLLTGPQVRSKMRSEIKRLKRMVRQMKSESLETLFLPAKKLVLEIAKQQGKQIRLSTQGTWLYLDKTLLNNLYEPILHLFRNAVDHGIEEPSERERVGKSSIGQIKCRAAFNPAGLKLIISDDGKGLDYAKIRERAVIKGMLSQEAAESTPIDELSPLVFESGFSTREHADSISGRGLGLDIVRKGIEAVDGTIRILSTSHHGTSFEISIPLNDDFSLKKANLVADQTKLSQEDEDKTLLLDELTGYFERLLRALAVLSKDKHITAAYEAFRLAHSIKGVAGFLGWNRVASFCHHYEDLLKLISEEKSPMDDAIVSLVVETGMKLKEFCEASKNESSYSLFQIRRLEARILQSIWAATHSEERTHLFLGKYHLGSVERILSPGSKGAKFIAKPEANFHKANTQPYGTLIQFSGDRRGYAGILLPEQTFEKLIYPIVTGNKDKVSVKGQIGALTEFGKLIGNEICDRARRTGITLQHSPPLTYYGWGQPLRILGNPTYCYECEINGFGFYLAGDFRLPQEMGDSASGDMELRFRPAMIMDEAKKQCQKHFAMGKLPVTFNEISTQSDLIGFDNGITAIISCISKEPKTADCVLFLSYEPSLAQHVYKEFGMEGCDKGANPQIDLFDCLNETSNTIGGMLIAELEKRKLDMQLSLPTVFIGKAYVANFNRLFVTNKMVGSTSKGKFELQILVTHLGD